MFKKIVIANRGEVALRILRACKEMGIETVVVHSMADADSMPVRLADESVCIGPDAPSKSYLNIPAILAAAEVSDAQAIHPGVGFLAEDAKFAEVVRDHHLVFIGPSAEHIAMMGNKVEARKKAKELGLKVIEGSDGAVGSVEEGLEIARSIGFPVLIKASAGGGGRGMRVVLSADTFEEQFEAARFESQASFGNGDVYIERYLEKPRHVELQILGDMQGNSVCLGERDCSLQRRHQKVWEEAPCPCLSESERRAVIELACGAMKTLGYYSAGTLEFLYKDGNFYFIEMNTRLQVEHPITEMITGIDIVKEQIRVAAGLPLPFKQEDIRFSGHSIECRINAENSRTFCPSPGLVQTYIAPGGPGVRVDSALFGGQVIPPYYDSLVAKLVVWGKDRDEALRRMRRALGEYVLTGVDSLIPLHQRLCDEPDIRAGIYDITWLGSFLQHQACCDCRDAQEAEDSDTDTDTDTDTDIDAAMDA